jgi:hypothetical protein
MRHMIPTLVAALMALSAAPALATDAPEPTAEASAVASAEAIALERVEAPKAGIAMSFPADWNVRTPLASRQSEIQAGPEEEPVYVMTVFMANAGDGRWCDVDVYLDMPAPLQEHAYAYASYLQQAKGPDSAMILTETELPAGATIRIDSFDQTQGRVWAMYLLDGPADESGAVDRFLLTCVADADSEPYWEAVAESVELMPAVVEEPAA